ncbi:MAG: hypothetical protein L0H19_00705, partial [Salinisphaera sp.]|nr:hypothetical protein [Salinisphaera sp.]
IHLSAMSAKLFGFARAIAHGMWLKARCVAALVDEIEQPAYRVQVSFKRPVLLPSEVKLAWRSHDQGIDLALMQPEGDLTHMLGQIAYLRANGSGAA